MSVIFFWGKSLSMDISCGLDIDGYFYHSDSIEEFYLISLNPFIFDIGDDI